MPLNSSIVEHNIQKNKDISFGEIKTLYASGLEVLGMFGISSIDPRCQITKYYIAHVGNQTQMDLADPIAVLM